MARKNDVDQHSRNRAGCFAAVGLVLMGAAVLTAVIGAGVGSGVLRADSSGLLLLAALAALLGLGIFLAASRFGRH